MDLTRHGEGGGQIKRFLHEEEIEPHQIGEYKVKTHREFVHRWGGKARAGPRMRLADTGRVHRHTARCVLCPSSTGPCAW